MHNPKNKECKQGETVLTKNGGFFKPCTCHMQGDIETCSKHYVKYCGECFTSQGDWVEELEVEIMERYLFLAKMEHLAKDPKKHMQEMQECWEQLTSFIRTQREQAVEAIREGRVPMGVSQWRNQGEKFGYGEYFNEETKKAFGGCTKCYGKGYATTKMQATSSEDFGWEKTGTWELDPVRPCSCDRGKQIVKILEQAKEEGRKEGYIEEGNKCYEHSQKDLEDYKEKLRKRIVEMDKLLITEDMPPMSYVYNKALSDILTIINETK